MATRPVVSCVIIFLNVERYIEEAIRSVFAQTFEDWELLLVDDGSTDASTSIARRYARENPGKVHYLEHRGHRNRGMSASRNLGICSAQGEFVALLDADDVWLPEKLRKQVEILTAHPEAAMVYDATRTWYTWTGEPDAEARERLRRLGAPPDSMVRPPELAAKFLTNQAETPGTCSVLMRRHAVRQLGGFVESFRGMFEDQAFFYKMCLEYPVFVSGGYTALYRQHPASHCHVAEQDGLYHPVRENPAMENFLDWLADYCHDRIVSSSHPARLLPVEIKAYLIGLRDARRSKTRTIKRVVRGLARRLFGRYRRASTTTNQADSQA